MSLTQAQHQQNFNEGRKNASKEGIAIHGNDGTVCMEMMFHTKDLVAFLNRKRGNGLGRLQKLATVMNHKGLWMLDYQGSAIEKWVREHEDLFSDITDEEHRRRLTSYPNVYMEHYGKPSPEPGMNEYVIEEYDESRLGREYKDNLLWFWAGEF